MSGWTTAAPQQLKHKPSQLDFGNLLGTSSSLKVSFPLCRAVFFVASKYKYNDNFGGFK
jgi:hypothetical protein